MEMLKLSVGACACSILEMSIRGGRRSISSSQKLDWWVYYFSKTKVLIALYELAKLNIQFYFFLVDWVHIP
jgi:hypothetical protein